MRQPTRHRTIHLTAATALAATLVPAGVAAQASGAPAAGPASAAPAGAPTRSPDRISLLPGADATTQMQVTWRTAESVRTSTVQVVAPGASTPRSVSASSTVQVTGAGYRHRYHTAIVTGLAAATTYRYRVGSGAAWSPWATMRTSAGRLVPHSFIAMGDVQHGIDTTWKKVVNRALTDKPGARALVQAGDLVNDPTSETQWSQVFATVGPLARRMPLLPVVGNHEYAKATTLSPQWRAQFPFPPAALGRQVPAALAGTVWSTDIDGVRHIGLNGYYRIPKTAAGRADWLERQARWLRRTVTTDPQRWTIVVFHYPVWSSSPGRANPELRRAWQPILESAGVDLVIEGHDHAYVRGQKARAGTPGSPGTRSTRGGGPVYVTSSASTKQYPLHTRDWTANGAVVARAFAGTPVYLAVDVTAERLVYRAKDANGRILDRFTMTKRAGTNTRVVTDR